MSDDSTYLAIYLGTMDSPKVAAWNAMPEAEQKAKGREGLAAWHAWVETHKDAIVVMGGPLGKTKKIGPAGIEDISNGLSGFTVVRAASFEAAARMFEDHPHFALFPGDSVELMPVLPVPGM
ncbi:MAG: hypothetical protein P4L82_03940 [Ancalomicrobiaceae bacterium]|nr:hypothetical protein [Ancalomicrobiaceae bacterium]